MEFNEHELAHLQWENCTFYCLVHLFMTIVSLSDYITAMSQEIASNWVAGTNDFDTYLITVKLGFI